MCCLQVGRLFGFQAFNETDEQYSEGAPEVNQAVPATVILAADHACTLLGAQYARLAEATYSHQNATLELEGSEEIFHQAVLKLHTILFESYAKW